MIFLQTPKRVEKYPNSVPALYIELEVLAYTYRIF